MTQLPESFADVEQLLRDMPIKRKDGKPGRHYWLFAANSSSGVLGGYHERCSIWLCRLINQQQQASWSAQES
jgi:hypothetical protein